MRAVEFKSRDFVEIDGKIYEIVEVERQKMANRRAYVRMKLKDLLSGAVIDRTFLSTEELKAPNVETRRGKFIYKEGRQFVFLDPETYEEYRLDENSVNEASKWFVEGVDFDIVISSGVPIRVIPPKIMEFEVSDTPPGVRGDTESGGSKPAKLSNGVVIQVPLHIKRGDRVRVNTETEEYAGRA